MGVDEDGGLVGEGFVGGGALVGFLGEEGFVVVVDLLHVLDVEAVELVCGDGFEFVEAIGELGIEAGFDGDAGGGGDVLELAVDAFVVVGLEDAEVLDDGDCAVGGGDLPGFDLVEAALGDLGDEVAVGLGGGVGGEEDGGGGEAGEQGSGGGEGAGVASEHEGLRFLWWDAGRDRPGRGID